MAAARVSFAPLPTPCEPMDRLGADLGFPAGGAARQTRRPHRARRWWQQGAQARDVVCRRARPRRRHARHRRRSAEQPRPDDRGRREPAGARVHGRAGLGSSGHADRQRRARRTPRPRDGVGRRPRLLRPSKLGSRTKPNGCGQQGACPTRYRSAAHPPSARSPTSTRHDELLEQAPDVDLVVVADGSGGTHAGLVGRPR